MRGSFAQPMHGHNTCTEIQDICIGGRPLIRLGFFDADF
jgi:hypothetical protein